MSRNEMSQWRKGEGEEKVENGWEKRQHGGEGNAGIFVDAHVI